MRVILTIILVLSTGTAVYDAADLGTVSPDKSHTSGLHEDAESNTTAGNQGNQRLEAELKAELRKKNENITEVLASLLSKGYTLDDIKDTVKMNFSALSTNALPEDDYELVKFMMNAQFGLHEMDQFGPNVLLLHPEENRGRNLSVYNTGVVAIGIRKFLSIAVEFCRDEGQRGEVTVVSVGCGDGGIEREIIAEYRDRVGDELNITLVDPDASFTVDFKTVSDLIEKQPTIVGNCVLLLIWPEPPGTSDNYDIESIVDLKPRAVLTLYETTGSSGSNDFCKVLHNEESSKVPPSDFGFYNWMAVHQLRNRQSVMDYGGLDDCTNNYSIEEVAIEKLSSGPLAGTSIFRVVKLKRIR